MKHLLDIEPVQLFFALRAVLYLAAGIGLFGIAPEHTEAILGVLAAVLGVDAATTREARKRVMSPSSTEAIVGGLFVTKVGRYIRDTVAKVVPQNRLTEGLALVAPLAIEYAQTELTDEARALLQRRVHEMLRAARLMKGRDIIPPTDDESAPSTRSPS
jgi:hypothetical protein